MYSLENRAFASIREVAEHYQLPYTTLLHRLDRGIALEQAVQMRYTTRQPITVDGRHFESIGDACRCFNVPNTTAQARYKRGWTPEQIFGLAAKPKQVRTKPVESKRWTSVVIKDVVYPSRKAAADAYKFPYQKFINRLKKGLTPHQALELEPFPDWFVPGKGQFAVRRKHRKELHELRSGKRLCSVCSTEKPLEQFNKSKVGERSYRCTTCTSKAFLRYRYGITAAIFQQLVMLQEGKCAICEAALEIKDDGICRTTNVAVDHCHKSGKVRGLLCKRCNIALGFMDDSVERFSRAISYLKQHQ